MYLNKEQIYLIHDKVLKDFGGDFGIYNYTDGRINSILSQLYPYFGYDKYSTIYEKASALLYFIIKGHCFVDGNKRLGLDSMITFLILNGYIDKLDDNEAYKKTIEIAKSELNENERDKYIKDLAMWIQKYFKIKIQAYVVKKKLF
jgi:death-on-curing protein